MKLQEVKRMFDFGGFSITGILFSSVFPDTDCTQAILMKGRRKRDGMEKLIFAIIEKGEGRRFKILDDISNTTKRPISSLRHPICLNFPSIKHSSASTPSVRGRFNLNTNRRKQNENDTDFL